MLRDKSRLGHFMMNSDIKNHISIVPQQAQIQQHLREIYSAFSMEF